MLETIREFGLQHLETSGDLDSTHHRLATYLLRLNDKATEQLRGPGFRSWLQRGDAEIENVRLSLDWATTHDPELALRLAREVGWYLLTRGGFVEARQRLERAFRQVGTIPDDLRAGALLDKGMYATTYLDFETASRDVEDALALYQQLDDPFGIAECVHGFGRIAVWSDDYERAALFFQEALVLFRALDSITLTVCCANLAASLFSLGRIDEAARVLEEGLAAGERFGDVWALVLIAGGLADVERYRGEFSRARQMLRRAFQLLQELQDPRYVAQELVGCACLAIEQGEDEQAAWMIGAATALRQSIGFSPEPVDEPEYVRLTPVAQSRIGIERWNEARESGRTFSQSESIQMALDWLDAGDL
jgi:tetratricopeptide (TPR) repeat protein